jgi:hypothetical protein
MPSNDDAVGGRHPNMREGMRGELWDSVKDYRERGGVKIP